SKKLLNEILETERYELHDDGGSFFFVIISGHWSSASKDFITSVFSQKYRNKSKMLIGRLFGFYLYMINRCNLAIELLQDGEASAK
ncbi:14697_t:CDS:2, partial [Entrophospora sp. SA101]